MSIFIPYNPEIVISTFTRWFSLDLTTLTDYQTLILCIISNAYFFIFWFFVLYFVLKLFNRLYERMF
uniref:Uncharacterized protein n=1 Tax=Dulem virus 59 TaxID=3145770 RepID=A0AAU8B5U5_9VIRU